MTDTQILAITIAIVFPVLGFVGTIAAWMHSNKRLDDFRFDLSKRLEDFEKRVMERLDNGFEHMELLLKLHEADHHNSNSKGN